ncbi:MAG: hypothetical protein DMG36_20335 [Acidobacteria bacterium]|nr:MAG: hypothetical protein DMG36_20335 [Acidobacteriota bacterium]
MLQWIAGIREIQYFLDGVVNGAYATARRKLGSLMARLTYIFSSSVHSAPLTSRPGEQEDAVRAIRTVWIGLLRVRVVRTRVVGTWRVRERWSDSIVVIRPWKNIAPCRINPRDVSIAVEQNESLTSWEVN